jgi:hypothetical protein
MVTTPSLSLISQKRLLANGGVTATFWFGHPMSQPVVCFGWKADFSGVGATLRCNFGRDERFGLS